MSTLVHLSDALPVQLPLHARGWHPRHSRDGEEANDGDQRRGEGRAGKGNVGTFSDLGPEIPNKFGAGPQRCLEETGFCQTGVTSLGISKMIRYVKVIHDQRPLPSRVPGNPRETSFPSGYLWGAWELAQSQWHPTL